MHKLPIAQSLAERDTSSPARSLAEIGLSIAPPNPTHPRSRAALINPPDPSSTDSWNRWIPPLGLGYIASVARYHGFHVDLFDFSRELALDDDIIERSGVLDYAVFGLSTYSEIWPTTVATFQRLRHLRPDAVIVVGGYHATSAGASILRDYPEVDYVICNEGEEPFTELLMCLADGRTPADVLNVIWRRPDGSIVRNGSRNNVLSLDLLPFPARDFAYYPKRHWNLTLGNHRANKDTVSMVSSRGCPKRCTFCSIIVLSPDYRTRSVESIMEEVRYLHARRPFGHIVFQDANFFVKVPRTLTFARTLHAFDPTISWSGTGTADQVSHHAEVLDEIGALNCAFLEIGIESGNDSTLARMNKKTRVSHNEKALALLAKARIGIGLDFIMFEPDMTFEDLVENVQFLYRNELFGYWPCEHIFQEMRLFPGTPIREIHGERLGVRFDDHEVPATPLYHPAVESAWRAMHWYMLHYHAPVGRLLRDIIEPVNRLIFDGADELAANAELVRKCQEAHVVLIRLRHLAYHFLERLLGQRRLLETKPQAAEVAKAIGLSFFDDCIEDATRTRDELRAALAGTPLEPIAAAWRAVRLDAHATDTHAANTHAADAQGA